jgi:glycosyltransferase involved in cell wall biosynthesis
LRTKHLDAISHTFLALIHALVTRQEIFHFHGVGPSLLSWVPRVFSPRAFVVSTFHCIDSKFAHKWGRVARTMLTMGEWAACRFPHATIVTSRSLKQYCAKRYHRKTAYIPNGTTIKQAPVKSTLKFAGRDYVLTVARLIPDKGIHLLIDAYRAVESRWNKRTPMPALLIVGDAPANDPYAQLLRERAKPSKNIVFAGYKTGEELRTIYANARLFVNPSFAEGFSTVLIEAQGQGVPVLASDIAGNRDALSSSGVTFRKGNVKDLALKLRTLLSASPGTLRDRGAQARTEVRALYDWDILVNQVETVYRAATS